MDTPLENHSSENGVDVSDNYIEILQQKKKDLEKLVVDIQKLEHSPSRSKGNSPKTKEVVTPEDEIYRRLITSEKEIKLKDERIERLLFEKKALSEIARQQEDGLIQLTSELSQSREQVLRLSHQLKTKSEESKLLFTAQKNQFDTNLETQTALLKQLEEEQKSKGRDKASIELYYHVMRLENQLKDSERVNKELMEENKTVNKMLKDAEDELIRLQNQALKPNTSAEQEVVLLHNRIVELSNNIADLQQENRMLLTIQNAKTEAIAKLTEELNLRGATEEFVEQLKKDLQTKDKELQQVVEDNRQLMRIAKEKEDVITELKSQEVGLPYHVWCEERRLLQNEVKKLQELKITQEKKIVQQKEHLLQLNERINFMAKTLGVSVPRGSPKSSRASSASRRFSLSSTPEKDAEKEAEDTVPGKLYEALEKNLKKVNATLNAKENELREKAEVVEMLERKLEILTKARETDLKKTKKKEKDLEAQVTVLKQTVEDLTEENQSFKKKFALDDIETF